MSKCRMFLAVSGVVVGSLTFTGCGNGASRSATAPTRVTVTRIGLYQVKVPPFSRTMTNRHIIQRLYRESSNMAHRALKPVSSPVHGVPPLGWDTGWGVALRITFWRGTHRLLTLTDTGRWAEVVNTQSPCTTHLLIGQQGAIGSRINPFLRQVYHAIGIQPKELFNTSAIHELWNASTCRHQSQNP